MSIDIKFIEYKGINASYCDIYDVLTFKEFSISEMLVLPCTQSTIDCILKVSADVNILNKKIFKTPNSSSVEGQSLTGQKLGVEGEIVTAITYNSDSDNQNINVMYYKTKFYISTTIPNYIKSIYSIGVNVYIENINIEQLNSRTLSENLVLLLAIE